MPPKKPPGGKPRRMQRPYQKGDITIEDQEREQKNLLDAASSYEQLNQQNLKIIAVSFEQRAFTESKSRDEYIARIRKKLDEWNYTPQTIAEQLAAPVPNPHPPLRVITNQPNAPPHPGPPRNPLDQARHSQAGLHHPPQSAHPQSALAHHGQYPPQSAPPHSTGPFARASTPPFSFANPNPISPSQPGFPGQAFGQFLPMQQPGAPQPPSATPIVPAPAASNFMDLFDPVFLSKLDLNDPNIRNQWIKAVWDFFVNGGTPYSTPPATSDSPVVSQKTLQDQQFGGAINQNSPKHQSAPPPPAQHQQLPQHQPQQHHNAHPQPHPQQHPHSAHPHPQAHPHGHPQPGQDMMVVDWRQFDERNVEVKDEGIGVGGMPLGQEFVYLQGGQEDPAAMTPGTFESWVLRS